MTLAWCSTVALVWLTLGCTEHGKGGGGSCRLESDRKKDNLAVGRALSERNRIDWRVDQPHVTAASSGLE